MEIRITQSKQLFHMSFLVSLGIISSNKQQKMNTENRKEKKVVMTYQLNSKKDK